jgi:hypothetical protein
MGLWSDGRPTGSFLKKDSRLVTICLQAFTRGIDRRNENHVTIATHSRSTDIFPRETFRF